MKGESENNWLNRTYVNGREDEHNINGHKEDL